MGLVQGAMVLLGSHHSPHHRRHLCRTPVGRRSYDRSQTSAGGPECRGVAGRSTWRPELEWLRASASGTAGDVVGSVVSTAPSGEARDGSGVLVRGRGLVSCLRGCPDVPLLRVPTLRWVPFLHDLLPHPTATWFRWRYPGRSGGEGRSGRVEFGRSGVWVGVSGESGRTVDRRVSVRGYRGDDRGHSDGGRVYHRGHRGVGESLYETLSLDLSFPVSDVSRPGSLRFSEQVLPRRTPTPGPHLALRRLVVPVRARGVRGVAPVASSDPRVSLLFSVQSVGDPTAETVDGPQGGGVRVLGGECVLHTQVPPSRLRGSLWPGTRWSRFVTPVEPRYGPKSVQPVGMGPRCVPDKSGYLKIVRVVRRGLGRSREVVTLLVLVVSTFQKWVVKVCKTLKITVARL